MSYLIIQMLAYIIIAALIGLCVGWIIFSNTTKKNEDNNIANHFSSEGDIDTSAAAAIALTSVHALKGDVYAVDKIRGIAPEISSSLNGVNIKTTHDLILTSHADSGRNIIANKLGVTTEEVKKWACMADLMRIPGIGAQYAELLEASGVRTIKELGIHNPDDLAKKLDKLNNDRPDLTQNNPSPQALKEWINNVISYPGVVEV